MRQRPGLSTWGENADNLEGLLTLSKTTKVRTTSTPNSADSGEVGALTLRWWKWKLLRPLWKIVQQLLTRLNVLSASSLATVALGFQPSELGKQTYK